MKLNVRRRVVAGAVTAVPTLLILGSFVMPSGTRVSAYTAPAQATTANVNLGCLTTPTPTALGLLPTPTPLPLCTPTPTALPTLPPLPTPTLPLPTPTLSVPVPTSPGSVPIPPGPTGTPGGSGSGTGPGSTGPGGSSPGGQSGVPLPPSTVLPVNTQSWPHNVGGRLLSADPLLAAEVEYVLQHPVAGQRPDLLHFSVDSSPVAALLAGFGVETPGAPGSPTPLLPGTAGALLLVGVLAGLVMLAINAQWRRLSSVLVIAPAALAIPLSAAAAILISQPAGATQAATDTAVETAAMTQPAAPPVTSLGALRAHALAPSAPITVRAWSNLVTIENSLTAQHNRLVNNESQIAAVTAALQQLPAKGTNAAPGLRSTAFQVLMSQLRTLVAQHTQVLAQYQKSLQGEYQFFVQTAQSPNQLNALQAAVSHTAPAVQNAVLFDLNVVRTQLAQQNTINSALAHTPGVTQPVTLTGPVTFQAPFSGVITQGFGPTGFTLEPPITYGGVFYPHFHTGLDIAAPMGTPVGAAAPGVVILATSSRDSAGNLVGYGNYVVIKHADGYVTLYGHLEQILATAGEQVAQGQVIGLLGSTGWSTGPHTHFEIRLNGVWMDPAPFVAAQLRR